MVLPPLFQIFSVSFYRTFDKKFTTKLIPAIQSCCDTLTGAATTPGHALNYAYNNKVRGAEEECQAQGIAFLPMVAESLGGWHTVAEREVKKLGAALARHTGQEEGEAISHLWGRLGVLLQRGNAAILGNRVPALPDANIDGIL